MPTVDEQISQSTNPQEFTRLCNAVFADIYGHEYQVIDGTRADGGNDGYVVPEKRVLAMYCPVKPEQRTDAEILKKIKSDFTKVLKLKESKEYEVDAWTFVTPRKLANEVVSELLELDQGDGITTSHQDATFLAVELARRPHLLKPFPDLYLSQLDEKLDAVLEQAKQVGRGRKADEPLEAVPVDETAHAELELIVQGFPSKELKSRLRSIIYKTPDPIAEINAILTLLRWFDPQDDREAGLLEFAERGITCADRLGISSASAMFHAYKAQFITFFSTLKHVNMWGAGMASSVLGMVDPGVEEAKVQLRKRQGDASAEAAAALDAAKKSQDSGAIANVLIILGNSIAQTAHVHRLIGDPGAADDTFRAVSRTLMAAKDIYNAIGDRTGAANAIFNLVNQLRFHEREQEALDLVESIIADADAQKDVLLIEKAKALKETIVSGRIPDYAAGERREWGKAARSL